MTAVESSSNRAESKKEKKKKKKGEREKRKSKESGFNQAKSFSMFNLIYSKVVKNYPQKVKNTEWCGFLHVSISKKTYFQIERVIRDCNIFTILPQFRF